MKGLAMKRIILVVVLFIGSSALLVGCVTAAEYAHAQAEAARLEIAISENEAKQADLIDQLEAAMNSTAPDSAEKVAAAITLIRESIATNDELKAMWAENNATMDKSDSGWDFVQTAAGAITTLLIGAPVGAGIVGSMRKRHAVVSTELSGAVGDFEGLIAAFAAGGGPKDPAAVRRSMRTRVGLKDRVTDHRVAIGDKVRTTTKSEDTTA